MVDGLIGILSALREHNMIDSLKTIGTTTGTLIVNIWQLVPEILGVVLIIFNILYIWLKIKKLYK